MTAEFPCQTMKMQIELVSFCSPCFRKILVCGFENAPMICWGMYHSMCNTFFLCAVTLSDTVSLFALICPVTCSTCII